MYIWLFGQNEKGVSLMTTDNITPELLSKLRKEEYSRVYPITVKDTINTRGSHGITQTGTQDGAVLDLLPDDMFNLCSPLTICLRTGKIHCRHNYGEKAKVELEPIS